MNNENIIEFNNTSSVQKPNPQNHFYNKLRNNGYSTTIEPQSSLLFLSGDNYYDKDVFNYNFSELSTYINSLTQKINELLEKVYPIGSIYLSIDKKFNPNDFFPGEWKLFSQGRVLVGAEKGGADLLDTDLSLENQIGGNSPDKNLSPKNYIEDERKQSSLEEGNQNNTKYFSEQGAERDDNMPLFFMNERGGNYEHLLEETQIPTHFHHPGKFPDQKEEDQTVDQYRFLVGKPWKSEEEGGAGWIGIDRNTYNYLNCWPINPYCAIPVSYYTSKGEDSLGMRFSPDMEHIYGGWKKVSNMPPYYAVAMWKRIK